MVLIFGAKVQYFFIASKRLQALHRKKMMKRRKIGHVMTRAWSFSWSSETIKKVATCVATFT